MDSLCGVQPSLRERKMTEMALASAICAETGRAQRGQGPTLGTWRRPEPSVFLHSVSSVRPCSAAPPPGMPVSALVGVG